MIDRTRFAVLFGLLGLACGLQCPKQKISPGREVVCYTSVSEVEQLTEAICRCTTLVQKGLDVRNLSVSEFEDFRKSLKEIVPTLQFVISVDDPAKTLRTSGTVRQEITARLIGVLKEVDGVELNMTAGTKERLAHFVKGLKDEFLRKSYDKRIFLVLPTKSEDLAKQYDLKELSKYVDLFTVPTHYLVEDDESYRTFHPSRLMGLFDMFNADSLIDLISGLGAPKRKILVSVPSSAYKFTLKDRDDNAPSAPTEEMQPIVIDQKQLCDLMNKGEWTVERDEDLTAPYSFKDKMWIAFEDRISVSIKGKYVLVRDLPGLGVQDIENDFKTKCGAPITHEIHHSFMDFKRKSRAAVLNALEDDLHQRELEYSTKVKSSEFRVVRVVDTEGHIRVVRENTQTEFTCSRQGYFVHPKSCNRFYRCVKFNQEVEDYSVFEFDCPAGLSFDESTEVCVWPGSMPEGSPCPGSSEIAPVTRVRFHCPSQTGYFADPQNPRWFFACIDLGGPEIMAYEFRCPYGLIFDEQKLICEWPWLVVSYSGSYTGSEYDSRGYGTGSTPGTGGYYTGALPHGYTGTGGGGGYTGTTVGAGSGFSGGSTGVGSTFGQGIGGYTGTTVTKGYGTSYGNQGLGGFSGSEGHGILFNQGTSNYIITTGVTGGYSATGGGFSGSKGISHGTTYIGQKTDGYSGTTGAGYFGSAGKDHGTSYTDQGSIGYSGTSGSGYSGTGTSQITDHGYGTINYGDKTGKTGSSNYDNPNGAEPDHYGSTSGVYTESHNTGYSGSRTNQVSSTGYIGTNQVHTGYTGSGQISTGHSRPGQVSTGYTGIGQVSTGYTGSGQVSTGYTGTGQESTGYTGTGQVFTGYTGSGQVSTGTGNLGHTETNGIYNGATGTSYTGPTHSSKTGTNLEYSEKDFSHGTGSQSIDKGYPGTTGHGGYSGTNVQFTNGYSRETPTIVTEDYSGSGIKDSLSSVKSPGSTYGSTISGSSAGTDYSGTGYIYTGQTGTKFSGSKTGGQSGQSSQTPIYTFSGTTGTGLTNIYSQTPIFVDKPNVPTCITIQCSPPPSSQTYTTNDYISNHGVTSETNVYQVTGEYTGGLNATLGGHVPSTPYYGDVTSNDIYKIKTTVGTGGIATGHGVQGSIITGDSTPGTLITYGGSSGTVFTGPSDQGSILTGASHPGYTKTGPSTPGYVVSDGIKTVYGSASPGTVIYGTSTPGVVITGAPETGTVVKGQTSPGLILTGQTAPGVSIGGSIDQGTIGSTGHHVFTDSGYTTPSGIVTPAYSYGTKIANVSPAHGTSYKTNEYYDNGGRSTIKFNNGDVTTKYTEKDIPDYRPSGESIPPDTLIPGSRDRSSYPSGFTKIGPTKTGFTTATLGAGGSYVISTGKSVPTPNPEHIGAKAFEGNVAGYTKSSTESSVNAAYSGATSTYSQDIGQSKPNLGLSKSPTYSYPTPNISFDSGVTKILPISSTKGSFITATTPTPFLNVELYNTPKFSEPVNPTVGTYQRPSGFTRAPTIGTPVGYTIGPFDNYKTTVFEAAKIPISVSTVHPLIDTGYKTVVSSTPVPVTISQDKYRTQTQSKFDFGIKTTQQGEYVTSTPATVFKISGPEFGSTTPSSSSGYFTTTKNVFETVTPSGISESLKQYLPSGTISPAIDTTYQYRKPSVIYQQSTPATSKTYTIESVTSDGSPTNVGISKEEVGKLITNYRGNTKYVPSQYDIYTTGSISGADYSKIHQQSSTSKPGYVASTSSATKTTQSPFSVTTYSGGYSKPSSIITYQTTAKSTAVGKGKVIVKWSDLHPLLLGKLGAECTCRGDPFANLRGPGSKLIDSSKGKVDLSNYDESEIYVDLEKENNSYEDGDYVTNYESSKGPIKIWNNQIQSHSQIQETPSSGYLPSVTPSISPDTSKFTANYRSGKSLNNVGSSTNIISATRNLDTPVNHFDGDGESEEIIDGATNCARPGLFRHPNFCNKFYACHWDEWKKKFTLHMFNCPVHLTFDNGAGACNWPSMGPACQDDNLLV
ncbi:mucin-19-like [Apis laboriosa]|uniref:mucin-19-like n=1 Tax=Apis laboriosa TaxID=183418 RepID=UPI001CC33CD5|nr:mucin-19-like [Apis laboriosa]XP_043801157.1 mucin-19-like [Apis laboriosa]